jgi:hypothetical protein
MARFGDSLENRVTGERRWFCEVTRTPAAFRAWVISSSSEAGLAPSPANSLVV